MKTLRFLLVLYAIHYVSGMFIPEYYLSNNMVQEYKHKKRQDQLFTTTDELDRKVIDMNDQLPIPGDSPHNGDNNDGDIDIPDEVVKRNPVAVAGIAVLGAIIGALVGCVAAPVMVFIGLGLLGFTVAGVALGSFAAWFMSLYGGSIATGSLVSILQSMGALGLLNLFGGMLPPLGSVAGILIAEYIIFKFIV